MRLSELGIAEDGAECPPKGGAFSSPRKRCRAEFSETEPCSLRKKARKTREEKDLIDPYAGVRQALAELGDEFTCPICCDLMAAAHLCNPCGHTICGECGWNWTMQAKSSPTCAICRAALAPHSAMIPNFALDNAIEKHVAAIAASGCTDWQPSGSKYIDWTTRKEKWRTGASKRAAASRRATRTQHAVHAPAAQSFTRARHGGVAPAAPAFPYAVIDLSVMDYEGYEGYEDSSHDEVFGDVAYFWE
ncbi:uncharacterized protein LAESUDRAFT_192104 [Laetiporus sulphureus 93-53]|uniref:RING-type domain-containing protein n=1 Tax=Laetiporus sulphureus 93-53 TaxID=1314785 RepID=A0A165E6U5_9APHY|nr:uncharacterized protein LAESUDRAFT_192104 [Laetiporus sulphureus 93-53]KZT06351.1 hypothetical protein LAESUDRAFT_192104 [Laetiporus sulphureus 93-53]